MALNQEDGEQAVLDTTPVAEQQAVEDVGEGEPTGSQQSTDTAGENSKGFQGRVRELNQRAKAAEERAQSLQEKVDALSKPQGFIPQMPAFNPNEPVVAPGEEIDGTELSRRLAIRETRIIQHAEARAELRSRQSDAINRINNETQEVVKLFPELDPDSEHFNEELSETITEATDAYIRNNPYSASVKQFVNKMMKPYKGAVNKEVGKATENIARQVSQAALRPNSVKQPEKTAAEKSIAELEAELGTVIS